MKKLLIIFFLLISITSFAQIKVLKVIGQPGIAKADSVNGYVTPTQLKSKINYTDSSSMLSPYLRKNDTTGKWISPAVANATYATISNLNLKANDNAVVHTTGTESIGGAKTFTLPIMVNGLIQSQGTGYNGSASPTVFLTNITASTGRKYGFNSSDGGIFQIFDVTAGNASRFVIDSIGRIGIGGAVPPNAGVEIMRPTEQLRLTYNATHYSSFTVNSAGDLTISGTSGKVTSASFIKSGGTSSQFLKADGSTDATSYEPAITAGTTSQYWSGNKTWQNVSSLPVQTAVQTALNAKLDTSFKQNLYAADPGTFINDSTFGLRQSFVDSLRNAGFTKKVFGMSLDGSNPVFGTDIVMNNHSSIWFNGSSNLYYYGLIPMNMYNGGLYFQIGSRDNIVMTPTGTSIDGINIPTAKLEIAASSGSAGDAPLKIDAGKLLSTPENGAIERDSATQRLYDTHLNKRELVAYTSDILSILSDSIGNRNYANDSIAVVDGKLSLHKFYRSGSDVKIVSTLPYFSALNYVIDATGANDSTQFQLHFNTSGLSFSVDWNDGKIDTISGFGAYAIVTHKYTSTGFYNPKITLNVGDAAKILEFIVNNYPYNTRITKVSNLAYLTGATLIDLSATQAIDSTTYDFAYPSTLTKFGVNITGITKFTPTHNLPAGLTTLDLSNNSLNSSAVDATLNWLVTQTFNAGTKNLYIKQQGSAPPTAASSSALSTLTSNGWVVSHD